MGAAVLLSFFLISCGRSSIAGTYENMGPVQGTKIEIKDDGTYIEWACESDMSGVDLQTADPNATIPMKCNQKSTGKWTLEGKVLQLAIYPYNFGVKPDKLFYNDVMYGGGTIEFLKK